jgi:hypothetical protein
MVPRINVFGYRVLVDPSLCLLMPQTATVADRGVNGVNGPTSLTPISTYPKGLPSPPGYFVKSFLPRPCVFRLRSH